METIFGRVRSPARSPQPVAYIIFSAFALYFVFLGALAWVLASTPPDAVFHLFGRAFGPADLAHHLIRRCVLLALLPALFAVELAIEGWQESSLRQLLLERPRSAWSDAIVFLLWNTPAGMTLAAAFSLGIALLPAAWLHRALANAMGVSIELGAWPVAAQVAVFCLVFSFFDYWQHRLEHSPQFWPLHRFHHSASEFCILTSVRVHPGVGISGALGVVLPAVLIGVNEPTLFWYGALVVMHRYLIHARINSDFGWIGRWVIQSPLHHRLHHKLDMSEPTSNFSLIPLWDRLFGTWKDVTDPHLAIGVATPYRHGAWVVPDLLRDYRDFWLALIGAYRDTAGMPAPRATAAANACKRLEGVEPGIAIGAYAPLRAAETSGEGRAVLLDLGQEDRLDPLKRQIRKFVGGTPARKLAREQGEAPTQAHETELSHTVRNLDAAGLTGNCVLTSREVERADDPLGA